MVSGKMRADLKPALLTDGSWHFCHISHCSSRNLLDLCELALRMYLQVVENVNVYEFI